MEKTFFRNDTFLTLLIIGISALLIWNILTLITTSNYLSLIPFAAQLVLLLLILTKNKYAKLGIKVWAILMIVGSSLSILGKTVQVFLGDEIEPKIVPLIWNIVLLFLGLIINHYNNTTVEIRSKDQIDPMKNVS